MDDIVRVLEKANEDARRYGSIITGFRMNEGTFRKIGEYLARSGITPERDDDETKVGAINGVPVFLNHDVPDDHVDILTERASSPRSLHTSAARFFRLFSKTDE